jgi:hypothetical protein
MTKLEEKRLRSSIWSNVAGCKCPSTVKDTSGKSIRYQGCTPRAVRCNERLARIHRELKKAGLSP